MNKLAAFAFTGLVASAIPASAASRLPVDPGDPTTPIVRPTDPLPPRFPKGPIVVIDDPCPKTLDATKSFKWDKTLYSGAGFDWTGGIGGSFGAVADCQQLAAVASVDLHTQAFGLAVKPLEISVTAATKKDTTNSIDLTVKSFGYELKKKNLANSASAIDESMQESYILPNGMFDGNYSYMSSYGNASLSYDTVANVAAWAMYTVKSDLVNLQMISSAVVNANLTGVVDTKWGSLTTNALLQVVRLTQGGHANLKPNTSGGWTADVSHTISVTDVLGVDLGFDVPVVGHKSIFQMTPGDWYDDYSYTHDFAKSF
jgi:hypothetical protein